MFGAATFVNRIVETLRSVVFGKIVVQQNRLEAEIRFADRLFLVTRINGIWEAREVDEAEEQSKTEHSAWVEGILNGDLKMAAVDFVHHCAKKVIAVVVVDGEVRSCLEFCSEEDMQSFADSAGYGAALFGGRVQVYHSEDLPDEESVRSKVIAAIAGGPDESHCGCSEESEDEEYQEGV